LNNSDECIQEEYTKLPTDVSFARMMLFMGSTALTGGL